MDKKETLFWKSIKKETKEMGFLFHRIENIANSGTPDLLCCHKNIGYFTIELKVTSNYKVVISPFQIGFNKMAWDNTFKAFYLVKTPEPRTLKLYGGNQGEELAKLGHIKVKPLFQGSRIADLVNYLLSAV